MKRSCLSLLAISLLLVTLTLTPYAQDKVLTEPIELIKAPNLTNGIIRAGSGHGTKIHLTCRSTYHPRDIIVVVDGKATTLEDLGATLKPDSIKSMCVLTRSAPEYAHYLLPGKKSVILVETHQASQKTSLTY